MKKALLPSSASLFTLALIAATALLMGCAGVRVKETRVATGAVHPRAIYIRPFPVTGEFDGHHGNSGERPIRESIAPSSFAESLQESLSKIAPSRVLQDDEIPEIGWLVEGELEVVHAGSPWLRSSPTSHFYPGGRSSLLANVRVYEVEKAGRVGDKSGLRSSKGKLIYDFSVSGGSGNYGPFGKIYLPGLGYAAPFDYRNAAERVYHVLSTDPHRYGVRTSPTIR
jgi:hypothetical protein